METENDFQTHISKISNTMETENDFQTHKG